MRGTFIKAITIITICLIWHSTSVSAQLSVSQLADIVEKGKAKFTTATTSNNPDDIRQALPAFQTYIRILQNKDSAAIAEKAFDPWQVINWTSASYFFLNDSREEEQSTFARNYYSQHKGTSYSNYYFAQEPCYKYFIRNNQVDKAESIAKELYDGAVASKDQSLILSACQYMQAWICGAKRDQAGALQWLEKAYDTGKKYADKEKGTYLYNTYIDMMIQLYQGYFTKGDYTKALNIINELEDNVKSQYGEDSPLYLQVLASKPDLLIIMNRYAEMPALFDKLDSLCNVVQNANPQLTAYVKSYVEKYRQIQHGQTQPTDTSKAGASTNEQIDMAFNNGVTEEAMKKAYAILEELEDSKTNPNLLLPYYNVPIQQITFILIGNKSFDLAKNVLDHADNFIKQRFNIDANATRVVETLYGLVYYHLGDLGQSLKHYNTAKRMFDNAGDHGQQYISLLSGMSDSYFSIGDLADVKLTYDYISKLFHDAYDNPTFENNMEIQAQKSFIASAYALLGYTDIAKKELEALFNKYGTNHQGQSWDSGRRMLAAIYIMEGDNNKSRDLLQQTLKTTTNNYERERALNGLIICEANNKSPQAVSYLSDYTNGVHSQVSMVMQSFSQLEKQIFWEKQTYQLSWGTNLVLGALPSNSQAKELAYDNALYVKSMQDQRLQQCAKWQDIKNMLGDKDVAIEFTATPYDAADDRFNHYGALILRKTDNTPIYVDLCKAEEIDGRWRDIIHTDETFINKAYDLDNTLLYRLLWQKIQPYLHQGDNIFYSLTGYLCCINFDAISNGQQRLGGIYHMQQVSTTAGISNIKNGKWKLQGETVAYGGLIYNEEDKEMLAAARPYQKPDMSKLMASRAAIQGDYTTRASVDVLYGTLEEAEYINQVFSAKGLKVKLYTDTQGNEESLKALSGKAPQVLHIGTHGFALSTNTDLDTHRTLIENPDLSDNRQQTQMLCTGLLMAGSDKAWHGKPIPDGVEDGILTAYEVSQLDLSQCNLVVLSACETGLGFINTFNGDIGMKRALKLAGAGTIVASLWQVPDEPTSLLMKTFYKSLSEGDTPRAALLKARSKVQEQYPQPYNWAGFFIID